MKEEIKLLELDLSTASRETIGLLIEDPSDPSLFEEIAKTNMNRPEILRLLTEISDIPEGARDLVYKALHLPVKPSTELKKVKRTPEMRAENIFQKVQRLNVSEKRLLALRGGRDVRTLLIKDPHKEVVLNVLGNPKITETEVEIIARSRTIPEEVIRKITKKREWMKNYSILLAVVTNPKTPPGIGTTLVIELKTRDLMALEKNKNISEAVRASVKRLLRLRREH